MMLMYHPIAQQVQRDRSRGNNGPCGQLSSAGRDMVWVKVSITKRSQSQDVS